MSMIVCHNQKFGKSDVRGMEIHNKRETARSKNEEIDPERSHLNYDLAAEQRGDQSYTQTVKARVKSAVQSGQTIRSDAVYMCSVVVSSDGEFFKNMPQEDQKRFFQTAKDALEKQFGKENTVAAVVHMDEKTPHMHFQFVPIDEDGKLRAKNVVGRTALRKMQEELPRELQRAGFKIERGVSREEKIKHTDTHQWKLEQRQKELLEKERELNQRQKELDAQITKAEEVKKQAETLLAEAKQRQLDINQLLEVKERTKVKKTMLGFGETVVEIKLEDYNKLASAAQAGIEAIHQNEPLKKQVEEMKSAVEKSEEYRRKVDSLQRDTQRMERTNNDLGQNLNVVANALYKTCSDRAGGDEIKSAALMLQMNVDRRLVVEATMQNARSALKIERSDESRRHAQRIVRDAEKTLENKLSRGSHRL